MKSTLGGAAGCGLRFLGRIMLGTVSDRSRIGNDVSPVFSKFLSDLGCSFCVAGAVFGEVGRVMPVASRIVNDVSYVMWINHELHFVWQARYLVR